MSDELQMRMVWADVEITANQFDTARWDNDNDGLSNVEELIAGMNPDVAICAQPVQPSLEFVQDEICRISWQTTPTARSYRVLENPDGISGFTDISRRLNTETTQFDHRVALFSRINAQYLVQSCNGEVCAGSEPLMVAGTLDNAIGYFKTSNPGNNDAFGTAISLSADGNTLAVGDETQALGIGVDQHGVTASMYPSKGNVHAFARIHGCWQQQANLKARNADYADLIGDAVSLSGDGNTLAVGVPGEGSAATGINGNQTGHSRLGLGAVYIY